MTQLVPSRQDAKTAAITQDTIPAECRMTNGQIANDPTLNFQQRHKLLKIEVQANCQLLKNTLDVKLRIEQARLKKNEQVAYAAIEAYGNQLIYQIRDDFTKTLKKWGLRVNMEQLRLLTDFGEQLTRFKADLQNRRLDPKFSKVILKAADNAFMNVTDQLGTLAQGIFAHASENGTNA